MSVFYALRASSTDGGQESRRAANAMEIRFRPRTVAITVLTALGAIGLGIRQHTKAAVRELPLSGADELREADLLAWNNRWMSATALYADIEKRAIEQRNEPAALYACVSQYVVRAESEPVQPLLLHIQQDLKLPIASSPELHLRLLVIEGMLATNFDASLARSTWDSVENEARNEHKYRLMMRALGEKGIADFYLGNIRSAKKEVTRAWIAAKYLHDPAAQVRYESVYGAGLVELQRYNEAIRVLDGAIKTAKAHKEIAYPSIAYNAKVDALRGLHQYSEALSLLAEYEARLPNDHLEAHLFPIWLSRGQIYEDMGNLDGAEKEYSRVLDSAKGIGFWRGVIQAGGLSASAKLKAGYFSDALRDINEAISANAHLPQELYYLPKNLAIKASILRAMKDHNTSNELYEQSLHIAAVLLSTAPTPNVKRQLIADLQQIYTGYFNALIEEGRLGAAFRVIESVRGRIEADALESHQRGPLQPTEKEARLATLNIALSRTVDRREREQIDSQIYEQEMGLIPQDPPTTFTSSPVGLRDLQRSLQEHELVLEYVLEEPRSQVIAITRSSARVYFLTGRQELRNQIYRYRHAIASKQEDNTDASQLFAELLGPVDEYLRHSQVVIVPDQELHLLPFASLMSNGKYIVLTHDISVSPSSTVLHLIRTRPMLHEGSKQFLGVAPWTEADEWTLAPIRDGAGLPTPLQVLPASRKEVENAASALGLSTTVLFGPGATETRFKRLALDEFAVLHLALHGYADKQYPDRSALIFAPELQGPDDGQLTVREVRSIRLNAQLVTLSACGTEDGSFGEADVANIANAFIDAGSRAVIAALWNVNDDAASRLMQTMYTALGHGDSISEALRRGQIRLIQERFPPYYWASFQVSGDGSHKL